MRDILQKGMSFNAVGAGQTANITVPVGGPVYERFYIKHTHTAGTLADAAALAANLERVQVKIDGDALIDLSGADLLTLNNFYGIPFTAGYLVIPFVRPEFMDVREELRFAIGTADVRQLSIEVKVKAGVAAPTLDLWYTVSQGVKRNLGQRIKIMSTAFGAQAAAGLREIHDLPVVGPERGRGLKAIHIGSGNIDECEIMRQGFPIHQAEAELLNLDNDMKAFQTVSRNPQAGFHHIDFSGNRATGIVSTENVSDFRLKMTFGAAEAAFAIITEETVGVADV